MPAKGYADVDKRSTDEGDKSIIRIYSVKGERRRKRRSAIKVTAKPTKKELTEIEN